MSVESEIEFSLLEHFIIIYLLRWKKVLKQIDTNVCLLGGEVRNLLLLLILSFQILYGNEWTLTYRYMMYVCAWHKWIQLFE